MKKALSLFLFLFLVFQLHASDGIRFTGVFNPMKGPVHPSEQEFRLSICLNGTWKFMPVYNATADDFAKPENMLWDATPIKIPSPWNVNAFTDGQGGDFNAYPSYPRQWEKAKIGWMQKTVSVPTSWDGQKIALRFDAIMGKAIIYVNGEMVAQNFELFLPFEVDVTHKIKPGQPNDILVGVAKADLFDQRSPYGRRTYVGGSMWGIEMAGIWQDVHLMATNKVFVEDIFVQPDVANGKLNVELTIANQTNRKISLGLEADVKKWYDGAGKTIAEAPIEEGELAKTPAISFLKQKNIHIEPQSSQKITISVQPNRELEHWTPETPNLYGLVVKLTEGKSTIDTKYERFGWRQFTIEGDRLLLNGKVITLRGDSWHFMGVPQMTRRYAWAWYTMLKDANANAVRLHAQPFPKFYMDMADEMGICVLSETGIWSSDGGPKIDSDDYWKNCAEHLRRLIGRDKNHASIFGWSVCNETVPVAVHVFKAPEELIQKQLSEINRWVAITRESDPTRQWI
ncbi:hypothetical protein LJC72_00525 [Bacteroides sp. OttesenSCG-928-D19]|nr:hypothetical protein [Bacteroides sp. OttesenSCG-928-D19]